MSQQIKAEIQKIKGKDFLVITAPINEPLENSASGKTKLVATTRGNMTTDVEIEGKPVIVGLNAYIKKD